MTIIASIDIVILVIYFVGILSIGFWAGKRPKTTEDFQMGSRTLPWFAVCLSIMATETSGVTFVGGPSDAYGRSLVFLQTTIGSIIARFLIAFLFIPAFYKFKVTTIYEFLQIRFGENTRATAAIYYYLTRLLAGGVRVLVASIALSVVAKIDLSISIIITIVVTLLYTIIGGMRAIIWTDVTQIIIFFGGPIFVLIYIIHRVGWNTIYSLAGPGSGHNHFQLFNWDLRLSNPHSILAMVLMGLFMTFAAMGCDYDMTQRALTCKNRKSSQLSLIWSGFLDVPIMTLFLMIGACLVAFYKVNPDPTLPTNTDYLFPHFIVNALPTGLKGLLIAGVFAASMSTLSSSYGALSTSGIRDIYQPYIKKGASDKHYLMASRIAILIFAVIYAVVTFILRRYESQILWLGFKIVSFTYGAMLGIFLLGVTTNRGKDSTNIIAMISSTVILILWAFGNSILTKLNIESKFLRDVFNIGWSWYVVIGTFWTYIFGVLFGPKRDLNKLRELKKDSATSQ